MRELQWRTAGVAAVILVVCLTTVAASESNLAGANRRV